MADLTITPSTSLRCAGSGMLPALVRRRAGVTLDMIPELWNAALRRLVAPARIGWRRSWIYRLILRGSMPDRIRHHPVDALPRRLEDADALLRYRFRFAGQAIEVKGESIFDHQPPSAAWAAALHGFEWLPALAEAGGDAARTLAETLITEWLERNSRYSEPVWLPEVTSRRLVRIFAHGRFVIANSDMLWRSRLFVSLRQQAALLARTAHEAQPGLPRLDAAVACVLSCVCLDDDPRNLEPALARLEREMAIQILPDGGHISRSPEELLSAYRQLVMAADALTAAGTAIPPWLRNGLDRMAPMLRFFRHGDGALALFNGGGEGDARSLAAVLARDEVRGQPFLHAPHSGYQRLTAARALLIMDCGTPPPGAYSTRAHAGSLAFEFGTAGQRLVVNCGTEREDEARWRGALRATAAHSTVTLADTSMAAVLPQGALRALLGPRLLSGPAGAETSRHETLHGCRVEASHAFYVPDFGIVHRREVMLSPRGTKLTGRDRLVPRSARGRGVPFAARFHIHPDVRLSRSHSGDILLKLASGEGWRFRHGGTVSIEESVYVGQGNVRRADQLVLAGVVTDEPVEIAWTFEQIGTD